jgi:hypothetical protein
VGGGKRTRILNSADADSLVILDNGNVGIGRTAPTTKLDLYSQSGRVLKVINSANSTDESAIVFQAAAADGQAGFEGLVVNGQSRVGIGRTNPLATLHVNSNTFNFDGIGNSFMQASSFSTGFGSNYQGNQQLSIRAAGAIWSESVVVASSDTRIKTNIVEIHDGDALEKLRLIEPHEYNYVDVISKGSQRVYGFLAQQVREHFPEAVSLRASVIPDVYTLYPVNLSSHTISIPGKAKTGKLHVITKTRFLELEVTSVDDNTVTFPEGSLTENDLEEDKVFVYGYEVEDFHTLNKDYLFTINFSATQELDRKVQTLEEDKRQLSDRVVSMETENQVLKGELSSLRLELLSLRNTLQEKGLIE